MSWLSDKFGDVWNNGADVVGSVWKDFTGQSGVDSANKQNVKLWREQRDYNTEMSNTAVQRRKADLIKAGINPMLAAGSVADTAAGSSAQVQARPATGPAMASIVGSLTGAISSLASAAQARAGAAYTAGPQTSATQASVDLTKATTDNVRATLGQIINNKYRQEIDNEIAAYDRDIRRMDTQQRQETLRGLIDSIKSENRLTNIQNSNQAEQAGTYIGKIGAIMREISGGDKVIMDLLGQLSNAIPAGLIKKAFNMGLKMGVK